jgi:glutathione S-transferase
MNTPTDGFVKKASAEIREIGRRDEALTKQEDDLRRKRAEMRARLAELNKALSVYKNLMGMSTEDESPQTADVQMPNSRSLTGGETIADLAFATIRRQGAPMKIGDVVEELQKLGKLKGGGATGRGDYGTVYRALNRDPRFLRSGKGEFSLVPATVPEQPASQSQTVPQA